VRPHLPQWPANRWTLHETHSLSSSWL
jgi:hypothetical protein